MINDHVIYQTPYASRQVIIETDTRPSESGGFNLSSVNYTLNHNNESFPLQIKLHKKYEGIIRTIRSIVEVRDPYTDIHQMRVANLALEISKILGLQSQKTAGVYVAALIHDIGKLNVPAEILCKPGRLSDLEYAIIKSHPQIGYEIMKWIDFPWPIARIVQEHHERIDGSGYPSGKERAGILIEARIVGVADVIEAMASDRPYRKSLGLNRALEEVTLKKGTIYDGDVVDAALQIFARQRARM